MNWIDVKEGIEAATGLERDALHIYGALLIQLGAALALRKSLAHPLPWLCAAAAEIANELLDALNDGRVEQWEIAGAMHDLWNTMLIPTAFLLLARHLPWLLTGPERPQDAEEVSKPPDVRP